MKKIITLIFLTILTTSVFAQNRLYQSPNFVSLARKHKKIAVLPFNATVSLRPKQMEQTTQEQLNRMGRDEGQAIQQSMYSWFLTRKQRGTMIVDVQNPMQTNAILEKNKISFEDIYKELPQDLASILDVDAVIMGTFETSKPMSEGASAALGLLIGFWGSTNKAVLNMYIYNGEDGETLFNYHRAINGSLGSNSDNLINKLMRKSSRKMAYTN